MTEIEQSLIERAIDTTKAWVVENWRRPIGTPGEILANLVQYDDEFYDRWLDWQEELNLDTDGVELTDPHMQPLLEAIERAQDSVADTPARERIGTRIAELRKAEGMTQQELAEASGVNRANIAKIEAGRYNASVDILERIAKALGAELTLN